MVNIRCGALDASAGALVGAVATVPMTAVMLTAQRLGLLGTQPPRRMADAAVDAADRATTGTEVDPPEPARRALAALTHLGIGAAMGVPFALARRALPGRAGDQAVGAVYGVAIWAAAYLGLVPALGVMPRADRDRRARPPSMIAAHLVYGWALGAGLRWSRPRA